MATISRESKQSKGLANRAILLFFERMDFANDPKLKTNPMSKLMIDALTMSLPNYLAPMDGAPRWEANFTAWLEEVNKMANESKPGN